jgi:hypothetical protein
MLANPVQWFGAFTGRLHLNNSKITLYWPPSSMVRGSTPLRVVAKSIVWPPLGLSRSSLLAIRCFYLSMAGGINQILNH